ncbi:hypothetical protein [Clostridium magnum]|uniref:Uncharacterized protein n=1 Tax=Clostridium magnum DSM 2767 TaxID=1121326 RepID=A0A162TM53_9CLOT|nr:hypothetical protein [Clostridium magnum]KZL92820.1 hypothetical protein CLMAG_26340 [Clostridium magnum DSM 2767]SHI28545.1 hypothetical protein SAMN02745944_04010 [Clostridium magnum DSM 2767]
MDINKISSDGWLSFIGSMIGAVATVISILIAIRMNNKQIKQQSIKSIRPYHDALKKSLPSYDSIMTQSDYLDEEDNLLGGSVTVEGRLSILEKYLNDDERTNELLEYKIERHKKYIEYWNKANSNIEEFINSGFYNAVKSACNGEVIKCYYDFVVAFHNEHFYSGPIIDTDLLRINLSRLFEAIKKAEKI